MPTCGEAAARLGVSRQRISQIYRSLGVDLAALRRSAADDARTYSATPRVVTGGVTLRETAVTVGHVSELLAAADLMSRGFQVFAPISQSRARVDLIAMDRSGACQRIEVRSGRRLPNGGLSFPKNRGRRLPYVDRYAVVLTGEPVRYVPALSDPASIADPDVRARLSE